MNNSTPSSTLDNEVKQACCNICTLAEIMKICATCPFNPANYPKKQVNTVSK